MKHMSPVMKFHFCLMVILMLFSIVSTIVLLIGVGFNLSSQPAEVGTLVRLYGTVNLVNVLALGCGVIYLMNGYSKKAAGYYQAFLLLVLVNSLLHIYITGLAGLSGLATGLYPLSQVIMALKVAILALLIFAKDLGEQRTRVLFGILVALDVAYVLMFGDTASIMPFRIISVLSRLSFDVTILLAILGKYADKDRRGTK